MTAGQVISGVMISQKLSGDILLYMSIDIIENISDHLPVFIEIGGHMTLLTNQC